MTIITVLPTAKEMSDGLSAVFSKLLDQNIIEDYEPIRQVCQQLKDLGNTKNWSISINRAAPIIFKTAIDEDEQVIFPQIIADIRVNETNPDFPYAQWVIALEVLYKNGTPLCRWHFDLANEGQSGPITHFQCGGHFRGARDSDLKLKIPRWHHPVVDIILLAEAVVANFYEDDWMKIREDRNWCKFINQSQHLCYPSFIKRMNDCLSQSSRTFLNTSWQVKEA